MLLNSKEKGSQLAAVAVVVVLRKSVNNWEEAIIVLMFCSIKSH